ncbi:growth-regulated alpha protein-like [Betta splendens]|uniref:Growth-regulated alpha protein-like n=1 Tax=Betta splendens TaxID=158456 RepID=A0A6P7LYH3_BETSP|nr:growth-regulated alpha protein-like [Betta splendens]
MKAVIQCLFLLMCMSLCMSAPILRCRCLNTQNRVQETEIVKIQVIEPTSYCNKTQIIIKLKNGKSVCLNPEKWNNMNRTTSKPKTASTTVSTTQLVA